MHVICTLRMNPIRGLHALPVVPCLLPVQVLFSYGWELTVLHEDIDMVSAIGGGLVSLGVAVCAMGATAQEKADMAAEASQPLVVSQGGGVRYILVDRNSMDAKRVTRIDFISTLAEPQGQPTPGVGEAQQQRQLQSSSVGQAADMCTAACEAGAATASQQCLNEHQDVSSFRHLQSMNGSQEFQHFAMQAGGAGSSAGMQSAQISDMLEKV